MPSTTVTAFIVALLVFICGEHLATAVVCFSGSEAQMRHDDGEAHQVNCSYACGMYERFSGTDQAYLFTEVVFGCLEKEMDEEELCLQESSAEIVLVRETTFAYLKLQAPNTNWETAWQAATGRLGRIRCCNEEQLEESPGLCMPLPKALEEPGAEGYPVCPVYRDEKNDVTIWRATRKELPVCANWAYVRDGQLRHALERAPQCPEKNFRGKKCQQLDNKDVAKRLGDAGDRENDDKHSSNIALVCCCQPAEYMAKFGVVTCFPDDPVVLYSCQRKGDTKLGPFQPGVSECLSLPYNEAIDLEIFGQYDDGKTEL